jgi:hypothetical protein
MFQKMGNMKSPKIDVMVLAVALFAVGLMVAMYWFQHETVQIGGYTVVYFKNRCDIDPEALPANLESLKTLPCLIRINWLERLAPDMFQEYSYLPGRGVEKTRKIHKK